MEAARIIGKEPFFFPQTLLIDKGAQQGIQKDYPVLALCRDRLGLVGRIIDVYPDTSQVLLIHDPRSELSALIQRTREDGVVRGKGNELEMVYLRPQADIKPGDRVITSGFGEVFPRGLDIGCVVRVSSGPYKLQKEAALKPVIFPKTIEEVLVLMRETSPLPPRERKRQ